MFIILSMTVPMMATSGLRNAEIFTRLKKGGSIDYVMGH